MGYSSGGPAKPIAGATRCILTDAGKSTLQAIGRVAREHQSAVLTALAEDE
jgi:stage V sporulation protein SpoVS